MYFSEYFEPHEVCVYLGGVSDIYERVLASVPAEWIKHDQFDGIFQYFGNGNSILKMCVFFRVLSVLKSVFFKKMGRLIFTSVCWQVF